MPRRHPGRLIKGTSMPAAKDRTIASDYWGPANPTWAIFLISVLGLFLEMLLIRWVSTEIRIFAYLQNTVLVVCFLGLGLGCFTCRQPIVLRQLLIPLFILMVLMAVPLTRLALGSTSDMLGTLGDLVIWGVSFHSSPWETMVYTSLGLVITFCIMVLIVLMFIPIGRILGRLMDDHPSTIWAYSVNVAGSLVGTWLFVLLSVLYQPPIMWFVVFAVFMLFFIPRSVRWWQLNLVLLLSIVALSWFASKTAHSLEVVWSPYQKLVLQETPVSGYGYMKRLKHLVNLFSPGTFREESSTDNVEQEHNQLGKYLLTVNNAGYQGLINLNEDYVASHPHIFSPKMNGLSQYDIPLLLHPHPQSFLIVGAGTGNDVAGGLRHGVQQITAVEIDPAIISMGKKYHPEKPYDSQAVRLVNDDARSFFATTHERYDVIAFGLLDSHTTTAMTNARLDNYVYTKEAIARAKSLLAKGGVMVLSFEAQKPFIADRMAGVLREVFGTEPIAFNLPRSSYGWGGVMFITGDLDTARRQINQNQQLASLIDERQKNRPLFFTYSTRIITDDWPYVYLQTPRIPMLYYLLAGLMVLLLLFCHNFLHTPLLINGWTRSNWHFFFLGAAFLLLEVQNISKASVALGNTWEVNAVIVSGVLVMILIANLLAAKFPRMPLGAVYASLIGTCLALYFVDLSRLAFLPYATKALIVGCLTTLPMIFSGIVFIRSFAVVAGKDIALGANLIGALVGALLQSVTFITGIKALLLIVAGLYLLSMLTRPRILEMDQVRARETFTALS
jgi:spermidine synthase